MYPQSPAAIHVSYMRPVMESNHPSEINSFEFYRWTNKAYASGSYRIQTYNLQIRNLLLYSIKLRNQIAGVFYFVRKPF